MPILIVLSLAVAYVWGASRVWSVAGVGHGVRRREAWCFALAMIALAAVLGPWSDAIADDLFSAHMTQHVVLSIIVPPLIVLGSPEIAFTWALPRRTRRPVARAFARLGVLASPLIAWLLHAAAIWLWHAPALYEAALRHEVAHAAEHASFVGTGVLLWWRIIHPRGERRTAYAIGILSLFGTAMHTGVLGALFTLSHHVMYPAQAAGAARWGFTALEDQQLAGLMMWVVGGLLYVVAMSALFVAWLEPGARRRAARAVAAAGVVSAVACGRNHKSVVPGGDVERGKQTIEAMGCGACHMIDGVTGAHGRVGPPLTGVASRSMLAGELPNTPENMMRWIEDPPAINPNTAMPNLGVKPQEARDIVAYLYTLR